MKKKWGIMAIACLLTASMAVAQGDATAWPQLQTFHTYMSTTFHPAEEGDFAPLKARADSLLVAATLWQASPIPANYKPAETIAALGKLVKQCTEIMKAVGSNADNVTLMKKITGAHDIFHTIVGECRKED